MQRVIFFATDLISGILSCMREYIGRQLGDYRILEAIGSGGMGQVYLAEHVHLRKRYAVKVLPAALAEDEGFVARFRDEGRVMADLLGGEGNSGPDSG